MRFIARYFIEWCGALALWTLFAYAASPAELLAGAACSVLAIIALEVTFRAEPFCFHPTPGMVRAIRKLPVLIAKGLWTLVSVLWRRMRGGQSESVFRVAQFEATGSDAVASARRVLAISFLTTPPNSIILGIDAKTKQMLVHQVKAAPLPAIVRELEAHP